MLLEELSCRSTEADDQIQRVIGKERVQVRYEPIILLRGGEASGDDPLLV